MISIYGKLVGQSSSFWQFAPLAGDGDMGPVVLVPRTEASVTPGAYAGYDALDLAANLAVELDLIPGRPRRRRGVPLPETIDAFCAIDG